MNRCLIFDLDGTLVDSERLGFQALKEMLPDMSEDVPALVGRYRGWRLATVLGDIEKTFGWTLPEDFEQRYRVRLNRLFDAELEAFPGAHDALAGLDAPKCIASSGPRAKIERSLSLTGLARFFGDDVFSAYELGVWKPDPGLFLHAAENMGAAPEDCIVIEDSEVGLMAAAAAGMTAVHFRPEGPIETPAREFSSYGDLAPLLAALLD